MQDLLGVVQNQIHFAHSVAYVDGQILHRQISGLGGGEEILAFGRKVKSERAGGTGGGVPNARRLIAYRDFDIGDASLVLIDGAARHHDIRGLQGSQAMQAIHAKRKTFTGSPRG